MTRAPDVYDLVEQAVRCSDCGNISAAGFDVTTEHCPAGGTSSTAHHWVLDDG